MDRKSPVKQRVQKLVRRNKKKEYPSEDEEHSLSDMPNQSTAVLGMSLIGEAGLLTTFAAMSALQKLQEKVKSIGSQTALDTVESSTLTPEESSASSTSLSPRGIWSSFLGTFKKDKESQTELKSSKRVFQNPIQDKFDSSPKSCRLMVCQHAEDANNWKLKLLENAQSSIEISGNYCGGEVFRKALDIIEERLSSRYSLEVHILCSPELIQSKDLAKVQELKKSFPKRFHFLLTKTICRNVLRKAPEELQSRENHVKAVVVDQMYFVVGGTNFEEHMGTQGVQDQSVSIGSSLYERFVLTASRDMDVVGFGRSVAKRLRQGFFTLFSNWLEVMSSNYAGLRYISAPQITSEQSNVRLVRSKGEEYPEELFALQQAHEENELLRKRVEELEKAIQLYSVEKISLEELKLVSNGSYYLDRAPKCLEVDEAEEARAQPHLAVNDAPITEQREEQDEVFQKEENEEQNSENISLDKKDANELCEDWILMNSRPKYWVGPNDSLEDSQDEVVIFNIKELSKTKRVEDEVGYVEELENHPCLISEPAQVSVIYSSWIMQDVSDLSNISSAHVPTTEVYIRMFTEAKESLLLAQLNFNPGPGVMDALLEAVNRGVKVTLITTPASNRTTIASHFYAWKNRVNYLPLLTGQAYLESREQAKKELKANVQIYEYDVERTTYHKKVCVVDGRFLLIGSYNLSQKSHYGDDELLLSIDSPYICAQAMEVLQEDISRSRAIPPQEALTYYFSWMSRFLSDVQSGRIARLIG